MSHMVTIDLQIKDLDALAQAAQECGLELVRGQQTHRWYGRWVGDYPLPEGFTQADLGKCEHAIRVKGASDRTYEIGVVTRRDGKPGFTLLFDFWNRGYGLEDKAGTRCSLLLQQYTRLCDEKLMRRKGFATHKIERGADGKLRLYMRG